MALRKPTWRDRIAYRLDLLLARGPVAQIVLLGFVTTFVMLVGAFAYASLVEKEGYGGSDAMWSAWHNLVDPTYHAWEEDPRMRWIGLFVGLAGMILFVMLVGLVNEAVARRLSAMRQGKSRVIAERHVLLVGWSDRTLPLLRQFALAFKASGGGVIVILADRPKEDMETEIRAAVRELHGTTVVCRQGVASDLADLELVAATAARSIVVLSGAKEPTEADADTLKAVLALKRALVEVEPSAGHIVVEVVDPENRALVLSVGEGRVEVVTSSEVVGRIIVQSARQPGLAHVVSSLLDFEGSEFYFVPRGEVGKTFGELRTTVSGAVLCGYRKLDVSVREGLRINPPDDEPVDKDVELLVLADEADSVRRVPPRGSALPEVGSKTAPPAERRPEHFLVCGWRRNVADMVKELDAFAAPGSKVTILAQISPREREEQLADASVPELRNIRLDHRVGSPILRRDLAATDLGRFDSVIVLADDTMDVDLERADARALVCLLLLRELGAARGATLNIISEIQDPRTKTLAQLANVSDYVASNELVSKLIAQITLQRALTAVWTDLLEADGSEVYLKDVRKYLDATEANGSVAFRDLASRARGFGDLAIGYMAQGDINPVLNPPEDAPPLRASDRLIVLAETDD